MDANEKVESVIDSKRRRSTLLLMLITMLIVGGVFYWWTSADKQEDAGVAGVYSQTYTTSETAEGYEGDITPPTFNENPDPEPSGSIEISNDSDVPVVVVNVSDDRPQVRLYLSPHDFLELVGKQVVATETSDITHDQASTLLSEGQKSALACVEGNEYSASFYSEVSLTGLNDLEGISGMPLRLPDDAPTPTFLTYGVVYAINASDCSVRIARTEEVAETVIVTDSSLFRLNASPGKSGTIPGEAEIPSPPTS